MSVRPIDLESAMSFSSADRNVGAFRMSYGSRGEVGGMHA